MLFKLENKTALITGAAGLLGLQHSIAVAEIGGDLLLTDKDKCSLDKTCKLVKQMFPENRINAAQLDVTNVVDVERLSDELTDEKIRVDILINNAARNPKVLSEAGLVKTQRLETLNVDEWYEDMHVGLTGPLLMSKVFGNLMAVDNKGGVIVNIASDLSVIAPDQRLYSLNGVKDTEQPVKPVSYSIVKTGLVGLTRYLATYWADKNVRVNALSPGGVFENQSIEFVTRVQDLIPMGRMANKSEYRGAIQFLCSDASSYMTGHNMVVDGGRSVW